MIPQADGAALAAAATAVLSKLAVEKRHQAHITGLYYCAVSLLFGMQANLVGPAATILARQAKAAEADLAPVMGVGGLMCIVGGVPSGWIVDAFPGHVILACSMAVQAVGFVFLPYCASVWSLTLVYAGIALTFNTVNTGLNSLTVWLFSERGSAFWLNMVSAMFGIGGLLAPMFVNLSVEYFHSDSLCFFIVAGIAAVGAAVVLLLPSPTNPALVPLTPQAAAAKAAAAGGSPAAQHGAVALACAGGRTAALASPLVGADKWRRAAGLLIPVAGIVFFNISIELTFGAWIYTYAVRQANMRESRAEMVTSLYWFAFTLGRALARFCPWTLYATVCLIGVGASAGYANTLSLTAEYLPLDGFLNGVFGTIAGVAWTVFPSIVPILAKRSAWGFQWLMVVMVAMAAFQFLLVFWIMSAGTALRRKQLACLAAVVGEEEDELGSGPETNRDGSLIEEGHGTGTLAEPLLGGVGR